MWMKKESKNGKRNTKSFFFLLSNDKWVLKKRLIGGDKTPNDQDLEKKVLKWVL